MKTIANHLATCLCLLSVGLFTACKGGQEEEKGLAATHPELAKELAKDSLHVPYNDPTDKELYNRYLITTEQYLNSKNYAVGDMYRGKLAPLDEASHSDAATYRTMLRKGLEEGVNFAGKYTVVSIGCGTSCQQHFVVDRETGKVLDKVQSSTGAKYSKDSRLLVVNPPDSAVNYQECRYCTPAYYEFVDGKFRKLEQGTP
ncbi:hypothetical protein [Pontibacter chinhatensis]|nr:hypothetical protein [Pontibacter chinhatensis]